ncbi:hypothetical protein ACJX0J_025819, partial [Zea mays]
INHLHYSVGEGHRSGHIIDLPVKFNNYSTRGQWYKYKYYIDQVIRVRVNRVKIWVDWIHTHLGFLNIEKGDSIGHDYTFPFSYKVQIIFFHYMLVDEGDKIWCTFPFPRNIFFHIHHRIKKGPLSLHVICVAIST